MTDRAAIVAAIDTYCRAQSEKDAAAWATLFAADVVHEDPVGLRRNRGRDHVTGPFWEEIVRNDVKIWLTDTVIVCGNEALAIMACEIGPEDDRRRMSPVVDQFVFDEAGLMTSVRGFYNLG
jgi:ketosteroid isomerase-like protein